VFGFALSGLQEFLYDISDDYSRRRRTELHAAKRLRLRSGILTLIPALVAHEVRNSDPSATVIYQGGGKLLLNASPAAVGEAEAKLQDLYEWLVRSSGGKLGAYWAATPDSTTSSGSLSSLLEALATAKWRAGRADRWTNSAGSIHDKAAESLGDEAWETQIGGDFARASEWVGFNVGSGDWAIGPWRVGIVTSGRCDIKLSALSKSGELSVSIPRYVPKDTDGSVTELFKLADEGPGAPYLAVLKMDGDGIGQVMHESLQKGIDSYQQKSKALSEFFGSKVPELFKSQFGRIYLVYSGGDDLVATGHFDVILRAAGAIRNQYHALGLGTVSAGVHFYDRNSPIIKAVEGAEEELELAKSTRDAIGVAGSRLFWFEFEQMLADTDSFVRGIEAGDFPRGSLQLLQRLGQPWLESSPAALRDRRWRSLPMLSYFRTRRDWPAEHGELGRVLDHLSTSDDNWPRATLVAGFAAWRTKQRG